MPVKVDLEIMKYMYHRGKKKLARPPSSFIFAELEYLRLDRSRDQGHLPRVEIGASRSMAAFPVIRRMFF